LDVAPGISCNVRPLSDRDPDAFLFFFAVNARAALEKRPDK
jgi:hypothetical protein